MKLTIITTAVWEVLPACTVSGEEIFYHLRALQVSPFSKKTLFSPTAALHLCPRQLSIHCLLPVPSAAAAVCVKCYKVAGLL
jgi:hypothetical protein